MDSATADAGAGKADCGGELEGVEVDGTGSNDDDDDEEEGTEEQMESGVGDVSP